MTKRSAIKAHMEVIGSDGRHVGIVDRLEGRNTIKLGRRDPKAGGLHHFIPVAWVDHVDAFVHLNKSSRDALAEWQVERPIIVPVATLTPSSPPAARPMRRRSRASREGEPAY
jgi:hypothetical protein